MSLENRNDHYEGAILPLSDKIESVALYGKTSYHSIAGGTGSGAVNYKYIVSIDEGLRNAGYIINQPLLGLYN